MKTHLIYGAGKWAHAHLRVLSELGKCKVFLTKPKFTGDQKRFFYTNYPIVEGLINLDDLYQVKPTEKVLTPDFTHIVTPSHSHLYTLNKIIDREKELKKNSDILIEKPAIVLKTISDYENCLEIWKEERNIHYCDWMAWSSIGKKSHKAN